MFSDYPDRVSSGNGVKAMDDKHLLKRLGVWLMNPTNWKLEIEVWLSTKDL